MSGCDRCETTAAKHLARFEDALGDLDSDRMRALALVRQVEIVREAAVRVSVEEEFVRWMFDGSYRGGACYES
jgi:hypothetical protein